MVHNLAPTPQRTPNDDHDDEDDEF